MSWRIASDRVIFTMRSPNRRRRAFTLIEMLVVMAVIAILVGIVLNLNALVQSKQARTRAQAEIQTLSVGIEAYKADNGSYPREEKVTEPPSQNGIVSWASAPITPQKDGDPTADKYKKASLSLYKALSGDLNVNERNEPNGTPPESKSYLSDFFTPQRLAVDPNKPVGTIGRVLYIKDPYGNSYGYSTNGAAAEDEFRSALTTNSSTAKRTTGYSYNPGFDLWSTGGKGSAPTPGVTGDVTNVWLKNW